MGPVYVYDCAGLAVRLTGGFKEAADAQGVVMRTITRTNDLHGAIALAIVRSPAPLTGAAFQFLRVRMKFSQARLAELLGLKGRQMISRWEGGHRPIPLWGDRVMRMYSLLWAGHDPRPILEALVELEPTAEAGEFRAEFNKDGWQVRGAGEGDGA